MTNLKKLTDAIDAQVVKGDIIAAFEQHAADHCNTLSNESDRTHSKAQKVEALRWFFSGISKVNRVERVAVKLLNDEVADSQFVFDFTDNHGNPMSFHEVIRRSWKGGKLVEELYLLGQVIEQEPSAAAAPAKKAAAQIATPKAAAVKAAAPKAEKAAPVKAAKAPKAEKVAAPKAEKIAPVKAAKTEKVAAPKAEKTAPAKATKAEKAVVSKKK